jgi:hypothetical protein
MVRIAVTLIWLAAFGNTASAQTETAPALGAVGIPAPQTRIFSASRGNEILRHRGPTGSPCLEVTGLARRHVVSPNVYDHVITAKNSCPQRIVIQVCYYNSQECLPMEIPGGERKEAVLGTMPAVKDFRFEFRERF